MKWNSELRSNRDAGTSSRELRAGGFDGFDGLIHRNGLADFVFGNNVKLHAAAS